MKILAFVLVAVFLSGVALVSSSSVQASTHVVRPDRPERPARPDRPDRPDRPTRSERPDRPDRPDRPERPTV